MTDLDPESQRILELATAARTPSAQDKTRVAERVGAALGVALGASAGAGAAHAAAASHGAGAIKASGSAAILKWIVASVALTATVSYMAISWRPEQPAPRSGSARPAPPAAAAAPSAADPQAAPAMTEPSSGRGAPPDELDPPPSTPPRVEHRRPGAAGPQPEEVELLYRAQIAWREQRPAAAIALLDEHRARFPHSSLEDVFDALKVLNLCELGKRDEARKLARSVIARAPKSPMRASLEHSCAMQ